MASLSTQLPRALCQADEPRNVGRELWIALRDALEMAEINPEFSRFSLSFGRPCLAAAQTI